MIKLRIDSKYIEKDKELLTMDVAPFIKNDRTFVPVRFVSEALGKNVLWEEQSQTVTIEDRKTRFSTLNECLIDWAYYWHAMSIACFIEIGSVIYKDKDGYYWGEPIFASNENPKQVNISIPQIRKGVAYIHSHSGGRKAQTESFSNADKSVGASAGVPIYLVDSGGDISEYYNGVTSLIVSNLPVDTKYIEIGKTSEYMRQYFKNGYNPLGNTIKYGYIADYYNMLYMNDIPYQKIPYNTNLNEGKAKVTEREIK